jgi:hypothetical protein
MKGVPKISKAVNSAQTKLSSNTIITIRLLADAIIIYKIKFIALYNVLNMSDQKIIL